MSLCRHIGTVMNKVIRFLFVTLTLCLSACESVPPNMTLCKPESFKRCRCWEDLGFVDISVCCTCEEGGELRTFCVEGEA